MRERLLPDHRLRVLNYRIGAATVANQDKHEAENTGAKMVPGTKPYTGRCGFRNWTGDTVRFKY